MLVALILLSKDSSFTCPLAGGILYGVCSFLIIICFSVGIYGQPTSLHFNQIGPRQGLNSPYNDFVYVDTRGYTWISSIDGIYKYNGTKVQKYTSEQAGSGLIDDNVQSNFFEQSNGNIWFATYESFNCYDRENDNFRHFRVSLDQNDTISENYHIFQLEQDSILWLRAGSWIFTYDIVRHESKKIIDTKGARFAFHRSGPDKLIQIYACLWDNGSGFELITIFDGSRVEKAYFPLTHIESSNQQFEIIGASVYNDGNAFLFSSQGLLCFNAGCPDSTTIYTIPDVPRTGITAGCRINDTLLLSFRGKGLWLFDIQNRKFSEFNNWSSESDQLNNNDFRGIYLDQNEILWNSSRKTQEINYRWLFANKFYNLLQEKKIGRVTTILEIKNGFVWCATEENGIFIFNQEGGLIKNFPYKKTWPLENFAPVRQLEINDSGEVLALSRGGIMKYDEIKENWSTIVKDKSDKYYSMLPLWSPYLITTCMNSDSLMIINEDNNSRQKFKLSPGLQILDRIGNVLYLSDNVNKIYAINISSNQVYITDTIDIASDVYTFTTSREDDAVYLGTLDGLIRLESLNEERKHGFTSFEKIINTPVFNTELDEDGKLWFTTSDGLWTYDHGSRLLNQYRKEDGLPGVDFVVNADIRTSNGFIWIGTNDGIIMFDPKTVKPYPYPPKVYIKSLRINGIVQNQMPDINETSKIKLKYFENNLEFEFYGLTHYLPSFVQLQYLLQKHQSDWKSVKNNEIISFNGLKPGFYILNVYGISSNGLKGGVKQLEIQIHPPFWQTLWFRLLILLLSGVLIYLSVRWYINHQLRRERAVFEQQRALQHERNRIAGELHDDLGSGLSMIRFLSEANAIREEAGPLRQNIDKISSTSAELLEKMGDIIWAMNTDNDHLENLVIYLRRYAHEYLDTHAIACRFELPKDIPEMQLSGKARRNILLSVKEALHNVVKHARATSVEVVVGFTDKLAVEVRDNGMGLTGRSETRPGSGNGLRNLRKRMEEIDGAVSFREQNGLTVRLEIPLMNEQKARRRKRPQQKL